MRRCDGRCVQLMTMGLLLVIILGSSGFNLWQVFRLDQSGHLEDAFLAQVDVDTIEVSGFKDTMRSLVYIAQPNFLSLEGYRVDAKGREFAMAPVFQFIYPFFDVSSFGPEDKLVLHAKGVVAASPVRLIDREDFFSLQGWLLTYMLFSIGIVFALFILSIAFALILRDHHFKVYAGFLAVSQLYMFTSSGLSRLAFGASGYGFMVFGFGTLWMVLYFLWRYLSIPDRLPCLAPLAKVTMVVVALGIPVTLVVTALDYEVGIRWCYYLLSGMGGWVSFFTLVALGRYLMRDYRLTFYFLTGSALQALTVLVMILSLMDLVLKSPIYQISYMAAATINCVFFTLGMIEQLKDAREQGTVFYQLAITDGLTQAYNRYYFETQIHAAISAYKAHSTSGVLVLVDIDHFKQVNDTYGHDVGDEVLKGLVAVLKPLVRRSDCLFRWGGEEFVVLMEGITVDQAMERCEVLRKSIEAHHFPVVGQVTVSMGLAAYQPEESLEAWFKRCDEATYRAKAQGRNRVCY